MIKDAALITISCVLFVNMGLSEAIQKTLHIKLRILSCPKCCTFWSCLAVLLLRKYDPIESVAASFISSYVALWATLIYDALSVLYNEIYELFTQTTDTAETSGPPDPTEAGDSDAVS